VHIEFVFEDVCRILELFGGDNVLLEDLSTFQRLAMQWDKQLWICSPWVYKTTLDLFTIYVFMKYYSSSYLSPYYN